MGEVLRMPLSTVSLFILYYGGMLLVMIFVRSQFKGRYFGSFPHDGDEYFGKSYPQLMMIHTQEE
jgi:hypothetical protein